MPEVQSVLRLTAEQNGKLAQHLHRQREGQHRRLQELGRLAPEERGKRLVEWQGEEEKQLQAILTPEQQKRFRQLLLQQQGLPALLDSAVSAELKLTESQQNTIRSALQEWDRGMRALFAPGPGGFDIEGMGRKIEALRKQADEKVIGALTAEQKQQWRAMLGAPFSFSSAGRVVLGGTGNDAPEETPLPADVSAGIEPAAP
jgi:hypothetical protein